MRVWPPPGLDLPDPRRSGWAGWGVGGGKASRSPAGSILANTERKNFFFSRHLLETFFPTFLFPPLPPSPDAQKEKLFFLMDPPWVTSPHSKGSRRMARPGSSTFVREFTRHSSDVLTNLNELRNRHLLTDVTLRVRGLPLHAHKLVLTACSGFFYSIFLGQGGHEVKVLTLPSSIEPAGFQALLDFMYTSRLLLTPGTVPAILAAASYLQMEHVVESCHRFIQASYDRVTFFLTPSALLFPCPKFQSLQEEAGPVTTSVPNHTQVIDAASAAESTLPRFSSPKDKGWGPMMSPGTGDQPPLGRPASPCESSGCASTPDPKACNWKKYKFIVLNSLLHEGQAEPPQSLGPASHDPDLSASGRGVTLHRPRVLPAKTPCSACHQPPSSLCPHPPEEEVSRIQEAPCSTGGPALQL
ncbi:hypothetical protein JRQ81_004514 [Phrynocephalus forsythii]|uniref:BTB domain-containing protein n=1 Tax=Phrynocephalus forsythii TaxID=171643 RepID=A0A9Q0XGA4_9SAUR|nr:hypothetical protein JRQ81_004514 [Phrynocephalus forsythii]